MAKSSNQMRTLLDKLDQLPPEQQVEVENYVDFLANKQRRRAALDRLLSIAPRTPFSKCRVTSAVSMSPA